MGRLGAILAGLVFGSLLVGPAAASTIATYSVKMSFANPGSPDPLTATGTFSLDLTTFTVADASITTPDGNGMFGTTYSGFAQDNLSIAGVMILTFHNSATAAVGISGQVLSLFVLGDLTDLSGPSGFVGAGNESFYFFLCGGLCVTRTYGALVDRVSVTTSPPPPAVPIPAALPLLATALGGMGVIGWRRKQQRTG
jgi:hypothetical protein